MAHAIVCPTHLTSDPALIASVLLLVGLAPPPSAQLFTRLYNCLGNTGQLRQIEEHNEDRELGGDEEQEEGRHLKERGRKEVFLVGNMTGEVGGGRFIAVRARRSAKRG